MERPMRITPPRAALSLILAFLFSMVCPVFANAQSQDEAYQIGMEAYVYFYPLVTMDVTRRQMTNIESGKMAGRGPMNSFTHMRTFPTADFKEVVRPNFDTLYSFAWLDLTKEPMIVSVPDTGGRYYLLPMMDMWSDVFAVPGKRTSGTTAASFAVVPLGWKGKLPGGTEMIQSSTPYVWITARTQTNGPSDYDAVHKIQDGFRITPMSQWGKTLVPAVFKSDPTVDMKTPPLEQVNKMPAKAYFSYAAELTKLHPPHLSDWSMVARLKHIGMEPGKSFDWDSLNPAIQDSLTRASVAGLKAMYAKLPTLAPVINGWQMNTDTMGVYGNYYFKRAIIAMVGLGANQPDDAVYPINFGDEDGRPLKGENRYVLHFDKSQLPPVEAFWSLTMYDANGNQVANALNRFALGDRDKLSFNPDGSLDLYIQHENPGPDKEPNWLPSPASGALSITLRLYAPKAPALYGRWTPPAVHLVESPTERLPQ